MKLYHNPRCSKSRQALAWLQEQGFEVEIRDYMKEGLRADEVGDVLAKLGVSPREFMRTKEAAYHETGADDPSRSDAELVEIIAAHPKLFERPVLVSGNAAAVGRPLDRIVELARK